MVMTLIGPFSQILTLRNLPLKGSIKDAELEIVAQAGIIILQNKIVEVGSFEKLIKQYPKIAIQEISEPMVLLPGFIDCHTHTCFAGSRAMDFAERNAGTSYIEIAEKGGGIWSSVSQTREATDENLKHLTENRVNEFLKSGITTIEIKSGYGLNVEQEMRILRIINELNVKSTVVPTCLAAHLKPRDFAGNHAEYLDLISKNLLPNINNLTNRVDIFTEKSAFSIEDSKKYLKTAQNLGYKITVHADQFTSGSSAMAVEFGALSADHLEASTKHDIEILAKSNTVSVALPGASIGLGEPFTPGRKLLDSGAILAIASDYNPGSAPMGDLLCQSSILATYQKLTTAEVLSALTFRAAKALDISDIGILDKGYKADFQAYNTDDYREILYHQGKLKPTKVWKNGELI